MYIANLLGTNVFVSDSRAIINDNFVDIDSSLDNKVSNSQVQTDVPIGALFTDTIYVHPTGDGNLHVIPTSTIHSGYGLQAGATAGSLTWVLLDKSVFGLSSLNNTSDLDKPISTAQQSALDLKAPLSNPTFTGTVTASTFSGNATSATKATQDGNGNVITSTYINLSSTKTVTASKETAKEPTMTGGWYASNSISLINETAGLGAGTYTLQNLLQQIINRSHSHSLTQVRGTNCNCNCACSDL